MKINKEQLISLLAERTDMDRGDVHRQFVELVGRIQQAEEDENTLEIDGFGTFMAVHDRLEFVPADILQTEINNKYAGMKPIELIGAYKEPHGEEVPVVVSPGDEELDQKPEAPISDTSAEKEEEAKELETVSEGEEQSEEIPQDTSNKPEDEPSKEPEDTEKSTEEPRKPLVANKAAQKNVDDTTDSGKSLSDDPLGKAIIIIVCILIIAAGGWLAYNAGLFGTDTTGDNPQPTSSNNELSANTQSNSSIENTSPADKTVAPTEQEDGTATKTNNEETASAAESTPYGLYGELNTGLTQGYYTIVVHSLRTMELAEEKKQEVTQENFRAKINQANVNGNTYYRVGIGQFETIKGAQEATRELPEPYKSNNFINRF